MELGNRTILCVDDDQDSRELLKLLFKQEGFQVATCETSEECLSLIKEKVLAAVVLDNRLGGSAGASLCNEIRIFNPTIPIVFYSGESRPQEIEKALLEGANAYLIKPNDFDKLTETVIKIIEEPGSNVVD